MCWRRYSTKFILAGFLMGGGDYGVDNNRAGWSIENMPSE